jgi:hypothetical protein
MPLAQSVTRLRYDGSAAQTLTMRIACEPRSFGSADPRTISLRRPPAAFHPLFTSGACEPNDGRLELACASRVEPVRSARSGGRAALAAQPPRA